ncbi:MAG TPA: glycosyltransferase family 87 protein [Ktedonobacterales bacterium]
MRSVIPIPIALAPQRRVLAALVGLGALAVGAAIWLHAIWPLTQIGYDFRMYLAAAHDVANGGDLYQQLAALTHDARPGSAGVRASGYVYPPLLAVVLALPVRLGLSDQGVWLLWNLLGAAAIIWMSYELNRGLRGRSDWPGTLAFAVATLLGAVATYDLALGQADLLVTALAVGACGLWLRRNPWAALPLGAAIAIKPTMGVILLVWLWKGDWRAVARGAIATTALLVAPFVIVGAQATQEYLTFLAQWNAFNANAEYINQAPYGMLLRLFTSNVYTQPLVDASWLVTPLRILVIVGAALWWMRVVPWQGTSDGAVALSECLLALPLTLIFSPLAEDIHYCALLPALVGLGYLAWSHGLARHPAAWVLWATLAFFCIPRMQELVLPDHLITLPGQDDPRIGPVIVLLRSGALLYGALATLIAGGLILRVAQTSSTAAPPLVVAS